ncbi:UPF0182 protein [Thermopolyspora flexuosa]|uniref:UPF0182 protein FHX40_0459 n=1 Tax=Thermopolyspora flexuosa TaxID=103836 RepID=A0A543IT96_9ACTN|nr:hypothetical protein FHX40_0459 [Thermopolyspora flexuosa]GGM84232.1 UPF0182 protein [Thermopolyspora flexuosa]
MSFRTPGAGRAMRLPRRPRLLLPVLIALGAIVLLFYIFTGIYTDYLWYESVNYTTVFSTVVWTQVLLFAVGALLMVGIVGGNMLLAYRIRPRFGIGMFGSASGADRYRMAVDPHRKVIFLIGMGLLALFAGSSTAGQWRTWLPFFNRTPFGVRDPQFDLDVSFFMFTLPFIRMLLNFLFTAVILSIIAAAIVHYLYGGFRLGQPGGVHATRGARAHLSALLGVFVLLKAVAYWVDRYDLAFSERGFVHGPSYTDVNAVLPAKTILAIIALLCAALFFAGVVRPGGMLPGVAFGLLVLSAVLIGGVYPALVEQFQVKPNQQAMEAPYIQRNIEATRKAYGVEDAQVEEYNAVTNAAQAKAQEDDTVPGVRLLDPSLISSSYQRWQGFRDYYQFPVKLDIDRYTINGVETDTVVAVREVKAPETNNWINRHLVYTHGYGMVAAPGNKVSDEGNPDFVEANIPPSNALGTYEPRIYFGENSPEYSVVGGGKIELDYVDDTNRQVSTQYTGKGGVPIGSFFNRLLYAAKYNEPNFILSGAINEKSKILYIRNPRERVQQVAPFLTLDGDPYPAIVGGRILWIIDGYTISNAYPYSQSNSLRDMTRDTSTEAHRVVGQPADRINYIRNSVKATVDAYDGTVTLYAWDDSDPLLRTWQKAFGGDIIKPRSEISPELKAHLRYPTDLFKVQREILSKYHVTEAQAFFSNTNVWNVPDDPNAKGIRQPPYYVTLRMPGSDKPTFSLTSTFTKGEAQLAAFMAVEATTEDANARIRILQLPAGSPIQGPVQVQTNFKAAIANDPTFQRSGSTEPIFGNLLTLPYRGGLLYVQPIYVQVKDAVKQYPVLTRVMVMFGSGQVGHGRTLEEALQQVFGRSDAQGERSESETREETATERTAVADAADKVKKAYEDAQEAFKAGDWAKYGEAQKALSEAIKEMEEAVRRAESAPSPSPSPTTSPEPAESPSPSPSPTASPEGSPPPGA